MKLMVRNDGTKKKQKLNLYAVPDNYNLPKEKPLINPFFKKKKKKSRLHKFLWG